MAGNNVMRLKQIEKYNRLIERQMGRAVRPFRKDGFVNLVNRYGTQKDQAEQYHFVPEPEYPDDLIVAFYESNGLFSKIIDTPAEEAVKHGFELADVDDREIVNFYEEALDELDWEETAMTAVKWARLFGGAVAVMLINDGKRLEDPLDWSRIQSIDDIRVFDRSLIMPEYSSYYVYDQHDPFRTRGSRLGMPERYRITSRNGYFTVHESRCLVFQNGVLPENAHSEMYRLWGVPEYARIHRAVRDAEVAHRNAPKLLERSVQPVYKMKNLAMELSTEQGEELLLRRLQAIDLARGTMNTIAVDTEGEDYDFKTFSFSGINDVISASCNLLSAVTNIPQTILFGSPVGGLSTTDDTAMETYYNYVARIQKRMLKSNLRYLLSVVFQAGVMTGEVDEVPSIKVKFRPLWSLSEVEQADLDQKKAATQQTRAQTAQIYVEMQAIDPSEVRAKLADSEEFDVENMLDEFDDEDLFGESVPDALSYLSEEDQRKAMEEYGPGMPGPHPPASGEGGAPDGEASAGVEVSEEKKNTDPGTQGSASTAAPAATKLPQDMSDEEKRKAATAQENRDTEDAADTDTQECGIAFLRAFILARKKPESGEGKSIDLTADRGTVKSPEKQNEDGPPLGNQNAAGPHKVSRKKAVEKKLVGKTTADGVKIKKVSRHALDRIGERSISEDTVERLLSTTVTSPGHTERTRCYESKNVRMVVDIKSGTVVSVMRRRNNK